MRAHEDTGFAQKELPPIPREMDASAWIDSEESDGGGGSDLSTRRPARSRPAIPSPPPTPPNPSTSYRSPLLTRSASAGEPLFRSDSVPQSTFERPSKSMALPDPSTYPDPYPFHPPNHLNSSPPGLSSADSSSASTRSSAYTSFGSALATSEDPHIHVAENDGSPMTHGILPDSLAQMLSNDPNSSYRNRAPVEQTRWSGYSASARSRSSSLATSNGNSTHSQGPDNVHKLRHQPSYDMTWQTVDERDEMGVSEEETDEDPLVTEDEYDEDVEEERTSAVVIAEEGRGLIVQGGSLPVSQLQVQPGTTHLLVGSSTTPNAMPSFLTGVIPEICSSLLALDISANFLGALPPALTLCVQLEELNIAFNPLRVLPVFLADLRNLRVLITDSTGISTLSDTLADLDKLHTISVRKNKMHALPNWLCLLPALQSLYVDGNPFQGPWKALVEPLLAKVPMTPAYPLSTPTFPLPSASLQGSDTDTEDYSEPPSSTANEGKFTLPVDEDYTITPDSQKAPLVNNDGASTTASPSTTSSQTRPLVRTRTTPNRAFYNQSRGKVVSEADNRKGPFLPKSIEPQPSLDSGYFGDHEIRKMKSAGDLRRNKSATPTDTPPESLPRPGLGHFATSASSSNLLASGSQLSPERPGMVKRFASVGPATAVGESGKNHGRPALTESMWDNTPAQSDASVPNSPDPSRVSSLANSPNPNESSPSPPLPHVSPDHNDDQKGTIRPRIKDGKEKNRWGFLKKMSMGKMKTDTPQRVTPLPGAISRPQRPPISNEPGSQERLSRSPQINMRISTTGNLDAFPPNIPTVVQPIPEKEPSTKKSADALKVPSNNLPHNASSSSLLLPPSPTPRSGKRRSFLPIDGASLNIPIPEASAFVPGMTAMNDDDQQPEHRDKTPSPVIDTEQYLRREQERAREAYTRALRSVMAYLRDMNDLSLSQQATQATMYGVSGEPMLSPRPRAYTSAGDSQREVSIAMSSGTGDSASHLREHIHGPRLRSGTSSQTMSVATTDSSGSTEERKIKDDKGKRAMVVKEILVTERTYVKGLQQLIDIYIKPACANVTILSGVSSSKDTVVPAAERKVVFGGLDALFSFHKESFLPALEMAAAPLMSPSTERDDMDGSLSLEVANAVGNIFFTHAAFMKMYSTYINNFDSAVQRVKYWTSDRQVTNNSSSPSPSMSPTSSTAQLVGLGLSMSAMSNPHIPADGAAAAGVPNLSSSQRKRIRSYLKRCRLHPQHSQLNLEGYLLLPIQRIPRYKLLLEELRRSTPQPYDYMEDPLDRALVEIASLANNMNEGKRESESRRKLVRWQSRIRGKFPSPLVQPHRRLIMDGPLLLTRVVRKAIVTFETINAQGDASTIDVDCLAPELTPRPLVGILCNDLLVLCRDPSEGRDPSSSVDLWAVLRMQTLPQPASIVHGNALRLVDNKAILYFDAPSASDALNWYRAINLHIPASKT
ncbi:grfa protein [Moniliophthora roreri]|nr:grfa protein [Moniliophthora roreri]